MCMFAQSCGQITYRTWQMIALEKPNWIRRNQFAVWAWQTIRRKRDTLLHRLFSRVKIADLTAWPFILYCGRRRRRGESAAYMLGAGGLNRGHHYEDMNVVKIGFAIRNSLSYFCGGLTLLMFFCVSRWTGDIVQRTSAFSTETNFWKLSRARPNISSSGASQLLTNSKIIWPIYCFQILLPPPY